MWQYAFSSSIITTKTLPPLINFLSAFLSHITVFSFSKPEKHATVYIANAIFFLGTVDHKEDYKENKGFRFQHTHSHLTSSCTTKTLYQITSTKLSLIAEIKNLLQPLVWQEGRVRHEDRLDDRTNWYIRLVMRHMKRLNFHKILGHKQA